MGSSFFAYDARSRLKTGLGQSFDYDRWGNLNPLGVDPMTNRIKAGGYDSRGNMVRSGTQTFRYDELSRQVAVDGGKERYLYDGAGERIARVTSTAPGLSLYTITPCRIRDTRDPPAMLAPFVPFTVQVTGGPCGIPPEAEALAGNLTALGSSQAGFILAQPAGTAGLDTSTINFAAGQTRANNFNLGLSTAGRIELTAPTPVHAIVDASGYYAYPGAASQETWNLTLRDEANRLSTDYTVTSLAATRKRNYFYFGNLLVATREEGSPVAWRYYASDHLGTPRVVTGSTGSVLESHTYRPFGEEIGGTFGLQPLKFAAMERDGSSGNDYNHARFQSPTLGRFLSVDRSGGFLTNPSSLNGYTYAFNNPLKYVDPTGETAWLAVGVIFGAGALQGGFRAFEYGLREQNPTLGGYVGQFGIGFSGGASGALAAIVTSPLGPLVSGGIGGTSDSLTVQLLEIASGQRASLSGVDLAGSALAGAASMAAGSVVVARNYRGGRVPKYFGHRKLSDLFSGRHPRVQEFFARDLATAFHAYALAGGLSTARDYGGWFSHPFGVGYLNFGLFLRSIPQRGSVAVSTCYGSYQQCYPHR